MSFVYYYCYEQGFEEKLLCLCVVNCGFVKEWMCFGGLQVVGYLSIIDFSYIIYFICQFLFIKIVVFKVGGDFLEDLLSNR